MTFFSPDTTSVISDLNLRIYMHRCWCSQPNIVEHLQAIKRVNYDQDIEPDTSINRMYNKKEKKKQQQFKNIF
ncbi:CLUMA_CG021305, isoform A [Clunio marinus]|uniref:CLUMA_CG021305, isoform A n=1 Tax=Clunio marinus TaxID=568069 RepID=A0A1J1J8T2_9DIPT|nr:CLUMA_CG021305, isoform A [Clunio marinus]